MELALNIAWLILSVGLVVLSTVRNGAACPAKRHRVVVAIALACLIAFLFPVISITDDLNGAAILTETTRSKRWMPSVELFAIVATGLLSAFYAQSSTWGDGSILSEAPRVSREVFGFHSSRRPPPAIS